MIVNLILLGVLQVTSYRPIAAQTKPECVSRDQCRTSIDDGVTRHGIAVSQDLLADGSVRYGDVLVVDGIDRLFVVNDCMGLRARRAIDIMVFTHAEEKRIGTRHLKVWVLSHTDVQTQKGTHHVIQKLSK